MTGILDFLATWAAFILLAAFFVLLVIATVLLVYFVRELVKAAIRMIAGDDEWM
jgi:hypothetical protein